MYGAAARYSESTLALAMGPGWLKGASTPAACRQLSAQGEKKSAVLKRDPCAFCTHAAKTKSTPIVSSQPPEARSSKFLETDKNRARQEGSTGLVPPQRVHLRVIHDHPPILLALLLLFLALGPLRHAVTLRLRARLRLAPRGGHVLLVRAQQRQVVAAARRVALVQHRGA